MSASKMVVWIFLFVSAPMLARAQWQRSVSTEKGDQTDVPSAHPLRYFTEHPFLRDEYELCIACTPADKAKTSEQYRVRTVIKPVGVLGGYRILDVLYHVSRRDSTETDPVPAKWKSILVQVGPDRFKEIFHLQAFFQTASLGSSHIARSGEERVLVTRDSDGGNGGGCWAAYWWFNRDGPHPLNFAPLETAMRARLPRGTRFPISFLCYGMSLSEQTVASAVQKARPQCHACNWLGTVTARFHLVGATAQPISVEYSSQHSPNSSASSR